MEQNTYLQRADACLEAVATWLEDFDPDEVDFTGADGVIKIEFPDGVTFVMNRQTAADQMWFAAGARAWHYDWGADTKQWRCDRDGHELMSNIAGTVGAKLGRELTPPPQE